MKWDMIEPLIITSIIQMNQVFELAWKEQENPYKRATDLPVNKYGYTRSEWNKLTNSYLAGMLYINNVARANTLGGILKQEVGSSVNITCINAEYQLEEFILSHTDYVYIAYTNKLID